MKLPTSIVSAGLLSLVFACASYAAPYCQKTITTYALDAITPLGFSGIDLLNTTYTGSISIKYGYKNKSVDGFLVTSWSPNISARYIASTAVYPPCTEEGGCEDIGIICQDRVEVDVDISLYSEDEGFEENWSGVIASPTPGNFTLNPGEYSSIDIKPSVINGNFYDDSNSPAPEWMFAGTFTAAGFSGEMFGWLSSCDGRACSSSRILGAIFSDNQ